MNPDDKKVTSDPVLRAEAEARLASNLPPEALARSAAELLHELRVHQIELEMQNEALRQSQLALEESRDRFVDLYEFAPVGYLTLSAEGMITEINLTAVTLLGRERGKLLNRSLSTLVIAADQDKWVRHFMGVRNQEVKRSIELTLKCGDGKVFSAQLDCVGNAAGVRITVSDITERKLKEKEAAEKREQIVQASKMESIGHLTAGIAHDFNNILGAIMGYTELSQHKLAAGKASAIEPYLAEIYKSGTRAKVLIRQMLTFSRLSPDENGGKAPITVLSTIVKEVLSMLRSTTPSTIELNYSIENNELKARIVPVNLHQIMLNLVVNARDAVGEYGRIDVTLTQQHYENKICSACKMPILGDFAQIKVQDNGSGIPEQVLSKVFDPFFTTKGLTKGTGMGLSVVHGLVHSQAGHIFVQSSVGTGTTVNILLPLETVEEKAQETSDRIAPTSNIKGAQIMVVEDEPALADMLNEYLSAYGAHIIVFTDPIKALASFAQNANNIDVVITDETMPGMSGMLLSEKILQIKPGMPIILCTGYSERATPEAAAQIGIAGFLSKPFDMKALLNKIQILREIQTK